MVYSLSTGGIESMATERLPLFPLKTVLMPGMALPLRIFEPRYQLMMRRVLAGERRFGVLLIRRGGEVGPGAEPYDLGTVAVVTAVEPLGGGLMDINIRGSRRFRVAAFHHDEPYLTGDVEYLSDDCRPSDTLRDLQRQVERLSREYVTTVLTLRDEQVGQVELPHDPVALSYTVAGVLGALRPSEAQALLASPTVEQRLCMELGLLHRELAILGRMAQMTARSGQISPN
jgi:Lon protease-like protein